MNKNIRKELLEKYKKDKDNFAISLAVRIIDYGLKISDKDLKWLRENFSDVITEDKIDTEGKDINILFRNYCLDNNKIPYSLLEKMVENDWKDKTFITIGTILVLPIIVAGIVISAGGNKHE